MSFGFAIGDFILVTQLAWSVVENARKACGAHDELTREVTNLHIVLQRLQHEVSAAESLLNRGGDNRREEIGVLVRGCETVLRTLSKILDKYNALPEEKRRVTRLWQKVRFGNGEMLDLASIRLELATHTNSATLFVNLLMLGSQGKVERHMNNHSEELKHIRQSLNWISASIHAATPEGTVWTSHVDDDKDVWRKFRRELIREGFKSSTIERHKTIIIKYLTELGTRGAFDQLNGGVDIPLQPEAHLDCLEIIPYSIHSDRDKEEAVVPRQEATPSDALEHSIDPYRYCLKHWDPREAPVRLVGSYFDMASLCDWIYRNVYVYDGLQASRVPLGSKPDYIATQIEQLRDLLTSFKANFALVQSSLSRTSGLGEETLLTFIQECEEPPRNFRKFVDEGEKRMLCARINRRLVEAQEKGDSEEPAKLSEIEWRGRNAIEAVWKAQPIESFGRRAGLDFVRNLAPKDGRASSQAQSFIILVHSLRILEWKFNQKCESICKGILVADGESALSDHAEKGFTPSLLSPSSMPSPSTSPLQNSGLETTQKSPIGHDTWREDIITAMGKDAIELSWLEALLRDSGVSEAELETEVVKLVIEARTVYPNGGKLISSKQN